MDVKKILVIFLLIVVYSILFWPTLNIYKNSGNILVKINRITGETHYFTGDGWRKINYEYEKSSIEKSIYKPIEPETENKTGSIKFVPYNEEKKVYGNVEVLGNE